MGKTFIAISSLISRVILTGHDKAFGDKFTDFIQKIVLLINMAVKSVTTICREN